MFRWKPEPHPVEDESARLREIARRFMFTDVKYPPDVLDRGVAAYRAAVRTMPWGIDHYRAAKAMRDAVRGAGLCPMVPAWCPYDATVRVRFA
jgi:hypothetical protein